MPSRPSEVASSLLRLMRSAISARVGGEVGVETGGVDAGGDDRGAHRGGVAGAFERHHGGVRGLVFVLIFGGERELGAFDARLGEDRPVLVDEADMAIVGDEPGQPRRRLLAVRAVVIEEGDDGDVAFGVAADRGRGIAEDLLDIDRGAGGAGIERGEGGEAEERAAAHGVSRCGEGVRLGPFHPGAQAVKAIPSGISRAPCGRTDAAGPGSTGRGRARRGRRGRGG